MFTRSWYDMTTNLMFTCPRNRYWKSRFWQMIEAEDIHKWVVGFEEGKDGYRHLQGRVRVSKGKEDAFATLKFWLPLAHVEECSDTWEYERKSGRFLSSEDTPEVRAVRFGKLRHEQEMWLKLIRTQSDREVTVIYDPVGCHGKSWFVNWAFEQNLGYWVPPQACTVEKIIQFVTAGYKGQEMILIDIPRAWKWSDQLYCAIESIKDGLIFDTRYTSSTRNIRGVKVAVFCNTLPQLDELSQDRWQIAQISDLDGYEYDKKKRRFVKKAESPLS